MQITANRRIILAVYIYRVRLTNIQISVRMQHPIHRNRPISSHTNTPTHTYTRNITSNIRFNKCTAHPLSIRQTYQIHIHNQPFVIPCTCLMLYHPPHPAQYYRMVCAGFVPPLIHASCLSAGIFILNMYYTGCSYAGLRASDVVVICSY